MEMMKRYLKDWEQKRLLDAARTNNTPLGQRDHAWMVLLIETGMRVNEVATTHLEQAEIALETGWLAIRAEQRKGAGVKRKDPKDPNEEKKPAKRKPHEYLVTEPVRRALKTLIALHHELRPMVQLPDDVKPPLLWGRCGEVKGKVLCEHMSVRSFQARMKHWAYLAGLPNGVSPHWLRHTRGVNIIRRSRGRNPLKVAQLALGHSTIASTGIYTQICREEFEAELRAVAGQRVPKAQARAMALRGGGL